MFLICIISVEEGGQSSESGSYIGPVIGTLSAVILLLVAAILFIVFRHRRGKNANSSVLPKFNDKRSKVNDFTHN
jgi:hypothetical protein